MRGPLSDNVACGETPFSEETRTNDERERHWPTLHRDMQDKKTK